MLNPYRESQYPLKFSITVSDDRSNTQIAEDIMRRFLPEYTRRFEAAIAEAERCRRSYEASVANRAKICNNIGVAQFRAGGKLSDQILFDGINHETGECPKPGTGGLSLMKQTGEDRFTMRLELSTADTLHVLFGRKAVTEKEGRSVYT